MKIYVVTAAVLILNSLFGIGCATSSKTNRPAANRRAGSAAATAVPQVSSCPFDSLQANWKSELLIYHFYVGQGDSTFVRTPSGTTMLIDAGIQGQGRATILPVLSSCQIDHLDYGVITLPRADHFGGWTDILSSNLKITRLYYATDADEVAGGAPDWNALKKLAKSRLGVSFLIPSLGETAITDPSEDVKFDIIARGCLTKEGLVMDCFTDSTLTRLKDNGAASIAQVITYKNFSYWTGGDLTAAGGDPKAGLPNVEALASKALANKKIRKVDVYHADGHGTIAGSGDELLSGLNPDYAVVSVGAGGVNGNSAEAGKPGDPSTALHLPDEGSLIRMGQHHVKEIFLTSRGETEGNMNGRPFAIDITIDPDIKATVVDNQKSDILLVSDGSMFSFHGAHITSTGNHQATSQNTGE